MADERAKSDANLIRSLLGVGNDADAEILRILLDPDSSRLLVDSLTEEVGHGAVGVGTKTVAAAGTRVQLSATSVVCARVWIQAHEANGDLTNGGLVAVGGVTVAAASATRNGKTFYATQGDWFKVDNLNLLYIDSVDAGAKVHYYYEV